MKGTVMNETCKHNPNYCPEPLKYKPGTSETVPPKVYKEPSTSRKAT